MIDGFDITSIENIRDQIVAWLGIGRFFGKALDASESADRAVYYGDRFRLTVEATPEEGVKYTQPFVPAVLLHIWTEKHSYCIVAKPCPAPFTGAAETLGYLGCTMSYRAPRCGEDWTRGADMHDGPFNEASWLAILTDIVGYEVQPVCVPTKGKPVVDVHSVG